MTPNDAVRKSNIDIDAPVFIWGSARSGSYLLYDLLSLHPELAFATTTFDRKKKGLWGWLHHGEAIPPGLQGMPKPVEGINAVWDPAGLPPELFEDRDHHPLEIDVQAVRDNYRKLLDGVSASNEKTRILDKCPRYLMFVDIIDKIFPDAYHIFTVRDPRLVVNSILRLIRFSENIHPHVVGGMYGRFYPSGFEDRADRPLVENLCWQHGELLRIGLGHMRRLGDRAQMHRYEDLVTDLWGAAEHLFGWAGLSPFPAIRDLVPEQVPALSTDWPTRGRDFESGFEICFEPGELGYFDQLADLAQRLGYDPATPGRIATPLRIEAT